MPTQQQEFDVVLIGGGIMSATLGSMLSVLEPGWRICLLEAADAMGTESSDTWHNAGTGHRGACELNYMPNPEDGSRPATIARQFQLSRQWWDSLARAGALRIADFLHSADHLSLVFGDRDVAYLRSRYRTLRALPEYSTLEFTEDPETIRRWAPLTMEGREPGGPMAATRDRRGTDVDFGALTRALTALVGERGADLRLGHHVRHLRRRGTAWQVSGRTAAGGTFDVRAARVFVGAGGQALRLLQASGIPEVRGYGVLPVGAAFLRCDDEAVARRHPVKVYGQADLGAPPMSVPHLDSRTSGGRAHLMFGPFATFSTKLLRRGHLGDFFATLRPHNLAVVGSAAARNLDLVRYLIGQLLASPAARLAALRRFYPLAEAGQWRLVPAGQRAQLVTPDARGLGVLQPGTEVVVGAGGTMTGLLGASPGASTAVAIMCEVLERSDPERWETTWRARLAEEIPGLTMERTAP